MNIEKELIKFIGYDVENTKILNMIYLRDKNLMYLNNCVYFNSVDGFSIDKTTDKTDYKISQYEVMQPIRDKKIKQMEEGREHLKKEYNKLLKEYNKVFNLN